jgi:hypothetical protein
MAAAVALRSRVIAWVWGVRTTGDALGRRRTSEGAARGHA